MKGTGPDRAGDGHSWIAPQYFIAATAIRGWFLRSWRVAALYAQGETDKARTLRTKHGPHGCRGKSSAAGLTKSDCFYKTHAAEASSCRRVAAPRSRAVRALSAVSALCPLLHERGAHHATSPADRCLGLDCAERRCRPRPVQSSFRTRSTKMVRLISAGRCLTG